MCEEARQGRCPHIHDPVRVAVCGRWLAGSCTVPDCPLQHRRCPDLMPLCSHFLKVRSVQLPEHVLLVATLPPGYGSWCCPGDNHYCQALFAATACRLPPWTVNWTPCLYVMIADTVSPQASGLPLLPLSQSPCHAFRATAPPPTAPTCTRPPPPTRPSVVPSCAATAREGPHAPRCTSQVRWPATGPGWEWAAARPGGWRRCVLLRAVGPRAALHVGVGVHR